MENVKISILLATYGNLLTEKQKEMMTLFYDCDLSLGEIAEEFAITRQAARDSIKRGEDSLVQYEQKLGFVSKSDKIYELLRRLKSARGDKDGDLEDKIIESLVDLVED